MPSWSDFKPTRETVTSGINTAVRGNTAEGGAGGRRQSQAPAKGSEPTPKVEVKNKPSADKRQIAANAKARPRKRRMLKQNLPAAPRKTTRTV